MLNRNIPPIAPPFTHKPLPDYTCRELSNGIKVYIMPFGTVEVVEIQAVFRAGKSFQSQNGVANFAVRNMPEGTKSYTSLEISQKLDNFGAWLNHEVEDQSISFSLATLSLHLSDTLPLLAEVLLEPAFPESEFQLLKTRTLQRMQVNAEKTTYIARKNFDELLFGKHHPYGMHFGEEELEPLQLDQLKAYHADYLYPGNFSLIATGRFDEDKVLAMLEKHFGKLPVRPANVEVPASATAAPVLKTGRHFFEKAGMQSTIRLGYQGIPFSHPDYYGMQVVNNILGGYFGSRLMKNIREEKGYTYGIYSAWLGRRHDGFFVVQSDVGNEYVEPTIHEVKSEMHLLVDKGVEAEELELVKNYMLGKSISQRETPFQLGDLVRYSITQNISFEEIDRKYDIIRDITKEEIRSLAEKYLKPDQMLEIVAGGLT